MKKFVFIVLHFRDVKNTKACIESLCHMKSPKDVAVEILVVDNYSPDPFPENEIKCKIGQVTVVKNAENLGFSGGMNSGMRSALEKGADYVVIVNNDTVFDEAFLQAANKFIASEKGMGIFVPKIYFYPGNEYHFDRYKENERGKVIWYAGGNIDWDNVIGFHRGVDEVDFGQHDKERETMYATGCCIVFPKEVIEHVGFFDDSYYLYYEDIDLSMRVRRKGFKIFFVPEAMLWHKNAKSSGGSGSPLQDYFISRNRMLFAMRYAPARTKLAILREGLRLLVSGREWQRKGVRDYFLGRYGKGSFIIS
ncbi:MAG: glycosyltransferase family 2 protein [bacterium]|nr:glycosyltransferase family 2 protein [bacterium]